MARCKKIRADRRRVCIAGLDRLITLQDRNIQTPSGGSADYTEAFSSFGGGVSAVEVWAMIKTLPAGSYVFDGVNTDRSITHEFYIRHIDNITAETWILYEGDRYDIVHTENLDQRDEFIKLSANIRGSSAKSNNSV